MRSLRKSWRETFAPVLRARWAAHGVTLLRIGVVFMSIAALGRLGNAFPQLLWESGILRAKDLKYRYGEVHRWFAGLPVYGAMENGDYPPASYAILWPFLGWLSFASARWLWAVTTIAALGWLAYLSVRESKASTFLQRIFVALLVFSAYPTHITIAGGQLINHILPMLLAGLFLLHSGRGRWQEDLLAASLLVPTLVKPTVSAPFFWIVCFMPSRLRPILLVSLGYITLTLLAASFQEVDLLTLLQNWLEQTRTQTNIEAGHANIHKWLAAAGLEEWRLPVSFALLIALGLWTRRHRQADIWILLGVAAVVSRFWISHRLQDDLLILAPMITLFRLAKQGPDLQGSDVTAGVLFALTWATMLAPARMLRFPPPLPIMMEAGQSIVWLAVLMFLASGRALAPCPQRSENAVYVA